MQWVRLEDEAAGVAHFVDQLTNERGVPPGEILVLCPRRLIGYGVRDALVKRGIPTHSFYHEEALQDDAAQEAFALLTLLVNNQDRAALRFWLGFGSPTWLAAQYQLIRQHCEESGTSPWDAMTALASGGLVIAKTSHIRARFNELATRLQRLSGKEGTELADLLFPDGKHWALGLREASLIACQDRVAPRDILDYLTTRVTQPEMPEHGQFVRVMSLHKAKGLTSRAVIVCGCIEGLIPFIDQAAPPNEQNAVLREQRRLFYVAITRCTELLLISSFTRIASKVARRIGATVRGPRWNVVQTLASRFLAELGPAAPKAVQGESILA